MNPSHKVTNTSILMFHQHHFRESHMPPMGVHPTTNSIIIWHPLCRSPQKSEEFLIHMNRSTGIPSFHSWAFTPPPLLVHATKFLDSCYNKYLSWHSHISISIHPSTNIIRIIIPVKTPMGTPPSEATNSIHLFPQEQSTLHWFMGHLSLRFQKPLTSSWKKVPQPTQNYGNPTYHQNWLPESPKTDGVPPIIKSFPWHAKNCGDPTSYYLCTNSSRIHSNPQEPLNYFGGNPMLTFDRCSWVPIPPALTFLLLTMP